MRSARTVGAGPDLRGAIPDNIEALSRHQAAASISPDPPVENLRQPNGAQTADRS